MQLYVNFQKIALFEDKMMDLKEQLENHMGAVSTVSLDFFLFIADETTQSFVHVLLLKNSIEIFVLLSAKLISSVLCELLLEEFT